MASTDEKALDVTEKGQPGKSHLPEGQKPVHPILWNLMLIVGSVLNKICLEAYNYCWICIQEMKTLILQNLSLC